MKHVELIKDCLKNYYGDNIVGKRPSNGQPVFLRNLSDEEQVEVFQAFCDMLRSGNIAISKHWHHIFLKVEQEAMDSMILED